MVPMRDIHKAVADIARQFQPHSITLFGSYAYGKPNKDSDVDLLILMSGGRIHDRGVQIRRRIDFAFPVDLLVRSTQEFQRRIAQGDYFLQEIQTKGKLLYEASHARVGRKGGRRLSNRPARAASKKVS
jgi:predicted nucleotidyltransferase